MATPQLEPEGFFTLERRADRWWLITPEGERFFSLGLNHIDPATMRYPENRDYILRNAGYSGWVALEYEASEEPLEAIPRWLDKLKKLI